MTFSNRVPVLNDLVTCTIFVTNAGGSSASDVQILNQLPNGLQFVTGAGWTVDAGSNQLRAALSNVSAGVMVSLSFQARATSVGQWVSQAEIRAANPADPNATPGNGYDNGEDDTARADIRVRANQ